MDQKKGRKLWLIIGIALLLIALAVVGLVSIFASDKETKQQSISNWDGTIYWNVDRAQYLVPGTVNVMHATCRNQRDGVYVLRMAVDGEQVDVKALDPVIVQQMDNWDLMGLVFDQEGFVIDVIGPDELPGSVLQDVYVQEAEGNTYTVNTSPYYNALQRQVIVPETAKVYRVANYDGSGLLVGMQATVSPDDRITVVYDEQGTVTHVFTEPYWTPGDIYYNTVRCFDSASGLSTRDADGMGYYNFEFALKGEIVNLRTKDFALATAIDKQSYCWMGLEFDEEGNISAVVSGSKVTHGKGALLNTTVRGIEQHGQGQRINTLSLVTRASGQVILHKNCEIYDFSGSSEYLGQPTQLREGDYIRCIQDHRGRIIYIAVYYRPGAAQYAYVMDRSYDSKTKQTTRKPDAEGWYTLKANVEGTVMQLRCKDRNLVNYLDAQSTCIAGVRLKGDEIVGTIPAAYTLAGYYLCSGWTLTAFDMDNKTLEVKSKDKVLTGVLSDHVKIFNASSLAGVPGQADNLMLGDSIRAYTNFKGEVEVIYINKRLMQSDIYRKLKSLGLQDDGYYHYLMAVGGEQLTVKAKAPDVVKQLDKSRTVGMWINDQGVAYKVVSAVDVKKCSGGVFAQNGTVTSIVDGDLKITDHGKIRAASMTYNCEVYDLFSTGSKTGRATDVRVGDTIQCFANQDGYIRLIYVLERTTHSGGSHCACFGAELDHTNCEAAAWMKLPAVVDNKISITKSGSYFLPGNLSAAVTIEPGLTVDLCLNGYTLQARTAITVQEGATLNLSNCGNEGCVASTHENHSGSAVLVNGGIVNLYSGELTGTNPEKTERTNRTVLISAGAFNMYGGVIADGHVIQNRNGGNVLLQSGTFTMLGGALIGGQVTGGKGGDVYVSSGATMILGGNAQAGQVFLGGDGKLKFHDSFQSASACVGMEDPSNTMENAKESYTETITGMDQDYVIAYDAVNQALFLQAKGHYHCVCVGSDLTGHTSCQQVLWQPVPAIANYKITITESGHYYLEQSVAATLVISDGVTADLCLNGFNLSGGTPVTVGSGATLNICDHTGLGWIFSTKTDSSGYAVKVDGGTVNLYSGTLSGKHSDKQAYNRPVQLVCGMFNMYGGAIQNGKSKSGEHGGNVHVVGGSFTMYGGIIQNGYTNKHGGNVCVQNGTFTMFGGIITNGKADGKGGNVVLLSDKDTRLARFILENGLIQNGTAQNGGNICVNAVTGNSVFTMYGGRVLGGSASQNGGAVFVYKTAGSVLEAVADAIIEGDIYLDADKQITTIEKEGA